MTVTASWFHLSVKPVSRSAGRSVVAAAAYRLGERINDERARMVHDYRARSGVESKFTVAPADAPDWALEPEQLWNKAEIAERRINSTLAREVELALPASVDADVRRAITEAFAMELVGRYGVAVSAAIHHPSAGGDDRNHHAHILFTTREMTAEGLGAKTRILDDRTTGPQEVHYLRSYASELINGALADSGSDERVDHRSFKTRGIDQEPTTHLGPIASEMERQGVESDIGNENRAVEERNRQRSVFDELVAELAAVDEEIRQELLRQDEPVESPVTLSDDDALQSMPGDELRNEAFSPDRSAQSPAVDPPSEDDFAQIHHENLKSARVEQETMAAEDGPARFQRVKTWWQNLQGHFSEWREHLQDRFGAYFRRDASPVDTPPLAGEGSPPSPPPAPEPDL